MVRARSDREGAAAPADETAAMWDALRSIDALADMPRHVVRAYVRSATRGWRHERARSFTRALHTLLRVRRTKGVIEAYPPGSRPRWR
jgi:DnaJ-domain-containing protein 1